MNVLSAVAVLCAMGLGVVSDERPQEQRLSFQSAAPWSPRINVNADVAIVYGVDKSLPRRIESWKSRGYRIHVMTGVSWGQYQDYLYGRFDGKNHEDEAQTDRSGEKISHGGDVYYMSPGEAYGRYLTVGVKRALDAGAEAIHLEEPEFWVRGGYEPSFRREWKAYYGDEWQAPDSSPDAQYRASKLKYYLYRRALSQVFSFVKEYEKASGRRIPCYVPTHSLLNYAHWRIVSPESSLLDVGCDGYIAQVWTGTARTPNVYEGELKERTFETAFLEYGAMQNLVRASGRRVWYLNDPVEDNPNHSWADYRYNWESTLVASLLQSEVWHYEIMPWPDRVFTGRFAAGDPATTKPSDRVTIPKDYETELQAVITALGDMKQPVDRVKWQLAGTQGVGVLVSDTMMFQRAAPGASDRHLGSFYGLAMPLLKRGFPVEPVQIEVAGKQGFLERYKLLLLTYEGQKPPTPDFHQNLASWVKNGGALLVIDDDADAFNAIKEWWNTNPMAYKTPREHLFEQLGLKSPKAGMHQVGKGVVLWEQASPAALTYQPDGADRVRELAGKAAAAVQLKWIESGALVLRRGPYILAAGLDESISPAAELRGRFINLFSGDLSAVDQLTLGPGQRRLLIDLDSLPKGMEGAIAASCRVRNQIIAPDSIRFQADGIENSRAIVLVMMGKKPAAVKVADEELPADAWDYSDGLLRIRFSNSADPQGVQISK